MRKFFKSVALTLMLCLLGGAVWAEVYVPPYSFDEVLQKVQKNELLEYERIWIYFLSHEDEERINAVEKTTAILSQAKQQYQQNKSDYNAVFNYAVCLMGFGHGSARNKYLEESIALFDEANALRDNVKEVYDAQSFALEQRVLGYAYYKSAGWSDERMISAWSKHPKFAAKELAVYGRQFAFEPKTRDERGIQGENIHHAYYIGCALGMPEALAYQKKFNTAKTRYNNSLDTPEEDARWDEFCAVMDEVRPLGLKLAKEAARKAYGEEPLKAVALKKAEIAKSLKEVGSAVKPAILEKMTADFKATGSELI